MSFLLDTDTCSYHVKTDGRLASRMVQHAGRLSISVLTVGELLTWARRHHAPVGRMEGLTELFQEVDVLLVDSDIANVFGELRASQFDDGRLTPSTDLWIASTAIAYGLTLVTHNTRDFEGITGLSLADWLTP